MGAGPWTSHEDLILRTEYTRLSRSGSTNVRWDTIARLLPGRNNRDVRKRWVNVLHRPHNKGTWTAEEDERLREAVQRHHTRWVTVAEIVGTRSADQCSKRWNQHLNPELLQTPWDQNEIVLLFSAISSHGNNWSLIQKLHFPRRPSNSIKNQHTIISRNEDRLRSIITITTGLPPCCNQTQMSYTEYDFNITDPDYAWQPPAWTQENTAAASSSSSYIPAAGSRYANARSDATRPAGTIPVSLPSSYSSEASSYMSNQTPPPSTFTWSTSSNHGTNQQQFLNTNIISHGILVPQTPMMGHPMIGHETESYHYGSMSPCSYSSPTTISSLPVTTSSSDITFYTQSPYNLSMTNMTSPFIGQQPYPNYGMYIEPPQRKGA